MTQNHQLSAVSDLLISSLHNRLGPSIGSPRGLISSIYPPPRPRIPKKAFWMVVASRCRFRMALFARSAVLIAAHSIGVRILPGGPARRCNVFTFHVDSVTMDPDARRQKRRETVVSSLNMAIEALNLAKEISSITPEIGRAHV